DRNAWGPQEDRASPDAIRRELAVATLLLDAGADLEAKNDSGATALHVAARSGNAEFTALLIARGARGNARDKVHNTPLHYAQKWHPSYTKGTGRDKVAELLLKSGATD